MNPARHAPRYVRSRTRRRTPASAPATTHLVTADPDRAHDALSSIYVDHSVRRSGNPSEFRFELQRTDAGPFEMIRLKYSTGADVETEPLRSFVIAHVLGGRIRIGTGGTGGTDAQDVRPPRDGIVLLPPGQRLRIAWKGLDSGLVRLDQALVEQVARECSSRAAHGVRFRSLRPVSRDAELHWLHTVGYVRHVSRRSESIGNPLIRNELARLLATTMLATFPNDVLDAPAAAGPAAGPAAVRRAVEFIENNAHRAISVTDIAAEAGVHPRSLQHAFRRHLGATPTEVLRRVRLDRAHRDLRAADAGKGVTVSAIAARWGFAHAGRFSIAYREAFGRAPSITLQS